MEILYILGVLEGFGVGFIVGFMVGIECVLTDCWCRTVEEIDESESVNQSEQ